MSNTLKFGGGLWATKEGSTLAYNDENDNYKPLPFDFARASNATVVNKEGLIETVGNGIPRIDFADSEDGALLLEPQRTNLVPYSNNFSNSSYIDNGVTATSGFLSPDGSLNAYKLSENNSNSLHRIYQTATVSASPNATNSIYVKYYGRRFVLMRIADSGVGRWYDIENGVLGTIFQGTPNDSTIEPVGNDWYRITISHTVASIARFELWVSDTESTSAYQGDTTKGVYLYGAQLEVGAYPTSYIPTQGSAVTRVAESCSQTTPSGVIGQTEGTMYWEGKFQDTTNPILMQIVPSSANYLSSIYIDFNKSANLINFYIYDSGLLQASFSKSATTETKYKIALAYKQNDIQAYVNGVSIGSDTNATIQSGLNNLLIGGLVGYINNSSFIGTKPNDVKLYNTRLSNSELATLTTI